MKQMLKSILKWSFIVIAVGFMAYFLIKNWNELYKYHWQFDTYRLIISIVLLWIALASATLMNELIFMEIAEARLEFWQMFRIFNLANLGRYLPGKVWSMLGMFYLASEAGIKKKQTFLAVIASEVAYKGSAILIGIFFFIFSPALKAYLPLMIVLLAMLIIFVHPKVLNKLTNPTLKLLKKEPIKITFKYLSILKYISLYFIVWLLHSLAFYVFVNSIASTKGYSIIQFFTIMPLTWVVGYLMIFAPGGIGVREGMLVLILSEFLPSEIALVIAILQRIWFIFIETLNTIIALNIRAKLSTRAES